MTYLPHLQPLHYALAKDGLWYKVDRHLYDNCRLYRKFTCTKVILYRDILVGRINSPTPCRRAA